MGVASVLMTLAGSARSAATQASMWRGFTPGSSPWMLTTTSYALSSRGSIASSTCTTRSVPVAQVPDVSTASPPTPASTRRMRSLSVATSTRSSSAAPVAAAYVCSIIVLPKNSASGLPGNRDDPSRAGITPSAFIFMTRLA